ncbi:DUF2635 domain-containing protein [Sphingomonas canadensis]|uniref:DUF2635 domain-containing protein n=1 Tax=Sphingomonas canadensis TaxID=1219257 RepID=A0ABW3H9C6_9SPHN|nr:DUF2635 domain-containing protein [Sphingomonas canadensis]MCW3835971.1 DUF2635 domain-containing protein [Sphingomonas canadensis]
MLLRRAVKPREGATIVNPETGQPLPAHGAVVAWDAFWQRRLNDGDVTETSEAAIAAAEDAAPEGEAKAKRRNGGDQ